MMKYHHLICIPPPHIKVPPPHGEVPPPHGEVPPPHGAKYHHLTVEYVMYLMLVVLTLIPHHNIGQLSGREDQVREVKQRN